MLTLVTLLSNAALAASGGPLQLFELDYDECIEFECHTSAVYPPVVTPTSYLATLRHRGPAPRPISITTVCQTLFGPGAQGLLLQTWQTPGITSGTCISPDEPDPTDPNEVEFPSLDEVLRSLDEFESDMNELGG